MGKTAFGWDNYVTDATVTADATAATGLDPSQVQNDQGAAQYAWQTTAGDLSAVLTITPPNPKQSWRAAGLFRTNLTTAATVLFQYYTNAGTLVTSESVGGPAAGYQQVLSVLSAAVTADYLKITITDTNNPDNCLNIPLVYAGPLWLPTYGRSANSSFGREHRTDQQITLGGQRHNTARWQHRFVGLAFDALSATDELWQYAMELDAQARLGGNVLAIPVVDGSLRTYEAVFGEMQTSDQMTFGLKTADRVAWSARITERL